VAQSFEEKFLAAAPKIGGLAGIIKRLYNQGEIPARAYVRQKTV
jgi:hypothetical protein